MLRPHSLSGILFLVLVLLASVSGAQERMGDVLKSFEEKKVLKYEEPATSVIEDQQKKKAGMPTADAKKVVVHKVQVDGNVVADGIQLLDDNQLSAIVSPYEGRELSLAEIYEVSDKITAACRAAGYLLAYSYVPAQTISEGVVNVNIVVGKVGNIDVVGNKHYKSSFVKKFLAKAQKDPLREKDIERALVLLNEYPELQVKAVLKAGDEPGTTDVVATVTDGVPVKFSAFYDNYGSKHTSQDRFGINFSLGNVFFGGDSFKLTGITAVNPLSISDLSYARVDYSFLASSCGARVGGYYTNSMFLNEHQFAPLVVDGRADVGGLYLSYPIVKTRTSSLTANLAFDVKNFSNYVTNNLAIHKNNLRIARLNFEYDFHDRFSGRNYIKFGVDQGFSGFLEGSKNGEYNTLPYDPKFDFTKLNIDLVRLQKLPGYNTLSLSFSSQFTDHVLPSPEQITIGGAHTVRGYQLSDQYGDKGFFATAEFLLSPFFPERQVMNRKLGDSFKLALFTDYGDVRKVKPVPNEVTPDYLSSIGAGIRLYLGEWLSVKYDFAIPRIDETYTFEKAEHLLNVTFRY